MALRALARVNLAAIERNCARLRGELDDRSRLCVVVKGNAYGHGTLPCARAALASGAQWLAVAAAGEAAELRAGGVEGPILVMGALGREELEVALAAQADVVAWRERFVERVAQAGAGRVHVKLDTGMGRLGTRDPGEAARVVEAVEAAPGLDLVGAMTHFATADDPASRFFDEQLERFVSWVGPLREQRPGLIVHAANSAATLRDRASHFDMVRCGIAVYGMDPSNADPDRYGLEPALALHSHVADVKRCEPGESAGYGRRFVAQRPTRIATLPIGYADGVRRGPANNGEALVRGRRYPLVGAVSMDNVTLDVGQQGEVESSDDAVLIGAQGSDRILAEDVAARLGTINYEVTCAISARVERLYHRDGAVTGG